MKTISIKDYVGTLYGLDETSIKESLSRLSGNNVLSVAQHLDISDIDPSKTIQKISDHITFDTYRFHVDCNLAVLRHENRFIYELDVYNAIGGRNCGAVGEKIRSKESYDSSHMAYDEGMNEMKRYIKEQNERI